ncbi:glycolate oxidase subunit [Lentisphaera araneosa HTCC2155]|uniref:Glycolate oxidase subunit n=1 Tax=Lentisphaera araneosa HTCC2155 TaxID=313628 RepID=A6DLY8_9BACT|nr:hypothetical protein [Lentisphaera araneosa]EDM27286.1 glycolate oxidase subunit [Lentisphaera araneosa HTCC2155]
MTRLKHFYDPDDMSICVPAHIKLSELKSSIEADQLYFPLAWDDDASLLEMLKLSPISSYSMIYGSWADNILGMNISYKGQDISIGGRVVKNVTGFDFTRAIAYGGWSVLEPKDLVLRLRPLNKVQSVKINGELEDLLSFCSALARSPWALAIDVLDLNYSQKEVYVSFHGEQVELEVLLQEMARRAKENDLFIAPLDYKFPFKMEDELTVIHCKISDSMQWCELMQKGLGGTGVLHYGNASIIWKSEQALAPEMIDQWNKELAIDGGFIKSKNYSPVINENNEVSHHKYLEQLGLTP